MNQYANDEQLWLDQFRAGDEAALHSIFRKYYAYLFHIARQMVRDTDTAKDMVQEVFVRIWQKHETLHVTATLKGYLQRAVVNQCISYLRSKRAFDSDEVLIATPDHIAVDAYQQVEFDSLEGVVRAAIDQLPQQCALIFRLSRFNELSYQEIADQLGIAPKTVENQIGKALKILRKNLEPYLAELVLTGLWVKYFF